MLILSRKRNQVVTIKGPDAEIRVTVTEIGRGKIRLGIEAPRGFLIVREELLQEIQKENRLSAVSDLEGLKVLIGRGADT